MTFPGPQHNGKRRAGPAVPQRVTFDAVQVAAMVAQRLMPGQPLALQPGVAIPMPDWAPLLVQLRERAGETGEDGPAADEADALELVEALAALQGRVAAIVERIAARHAADPPPAPPSNIVIAREAPPEPPRLRRVP